MEKKQTGTGNATGPATKEVSFLNRIDLSSPDIHQSVSLLKQVIQFNNLNSHASLFFERNKIEKKKTEKTVYCVSVIVKIICVFLY